MGFLVRPLVLEVGSVFDLILILKGISLRHVGRYSSVLYLFVDFLALWKNSFCIISCDFTFVANDHADAQDDFEFLQLRDSLPFPLVPSSGV